MNTPLRSSNVKSVSLFRPTPAVAIAADELKKRFIDVARDGPLFSRYGPLISSVSVTLAMRQGWAFKLLGLIKKRGFGIEDYGAFLLSEKVRTRSFAVAQAVMAAYIDKPRTDLLITSRLRKRCSRLRERFARQRVYRKLVTLRVHDVKKTRGARESGSVRSAKRKLEEIAKISWQAGGVLSAQKAAAREEREERYRKAAKDKAKQTYKQIPKQDRAERVRNARDKRVPVFAEEQAGGFLKVAVGTLVAQTVRVLGKFGRAADGASGALAGAQSAINSLKSAVKAFLDKVGAVTGKIALVMVFWFATKQIRMPPILRVMLWTPFLVTILGKDLWECVSAFFPSGDDTLVDQVKVEEQVGGFSTAAALFSTATVFSAFKEKRGSKVTELCKRLSMLDRMTSGWDTFLTWICKAFEAVVNFCRDKMGKEPIAIIGKARDPIEKWMSDVDKTSTTAAQWLRKVDAATVDLSVSGRDVDMEFLDELVRLVQVGYGFKEVSRGTVFAREIDSYCLRAVSNLAPFVGALEARNNFRFQPEFMLLYGAPGVGKTALCVPLTMAVLSQSGLLPPDADEEVAMRNMWQKGESKYWNGYAKQLALIMDDCFQVKTMTGEDESEYMQIIRMIGTWSFPLNFADLASKGKIYFGSKFVLGTTNLGGLRSQAQVVINQPEAVFRRISHGYKLVVNAPYAKPNGELDYAKLASERAACEDKEGLESFPWYVWSFMKHDFDHDSTVDVKLPVIDVIRELCATLRKRIVDHADDKQSYGRMFGRLQASRQISEQAGGLLESTPALKKSWFPQCVLSGVGHVLTTPREFARKAKDMLREHLDETSKWKSLATCLTAAVVSTVVLSLALKVLVGVVKTVLGAVFGAVGIRRRKRGVRVREQSNTPGPKVMRGSKRVVVEQVATPHLTDMVVSNCYKMTIGDRMLGTITFLESNLAVQPAHFTRHLRKWLDDGDVSDSDTVVFTHANNSEFSVSFSVKAYMDMKRLTHTDRDVEFVSFPTMRSHRAITSQLIPAAKLPYVEGQLLCMSCPKLVRTRNGDLDSSVHCHTFYSEGLGENLDYMAGENRRLEIYHRYIGVPTVQGDCGAPITFRDSSRYNACWLGFHVAVFDEFSGGIGAVLTREMAENALKHFTTVRDSFSANLEKKGISFEMGDVSAFPKSGSFLPIGCLKKGISLAPYTNYYPTNFYGKWGDYTQKPAILRPVRRGEEIVYPMVNAVTPYSSEVLHYEQPWLRQAMHIAMRKFTSLSARFPRRIHTFQEAVSGIPSIGYRGLPLNTSPGFPWVQTLKGGKKEVWGTAEERDFTTPGSKLVEQAVEDLLDSAKDNERTAVLWYDFLKDELRSAEKVEAVATRLISCGPLDYVVAVRMMFGSFTDAFMKCHVSSGMAPGACVYSDWDRIAQTLLSKGGNVFDGDFKGFDSSQQPVILELIRDYINDWYDDGEENRRVRNVLWEDLVHSRHIGGLGNDQRFVYQWNKCLPSGHPLTTVVNSIYSLFLLVAAYHMSLGCAQNFWDHVAPMTYGDDNVSGVTPEVTPFFNQRTVALALRSGFNVKYTPGNKGVDFIEVTNIDNVTFLKRSFRYSRDTGWYGPLDPDSFLYLVYYCKNRLLEKKVLYDCLEITLQEMSMHEVLWEKYAKQVYKSYTLLGKSVVPMNPCCREDYLRVVLSRKDNGW